MPVAYLHRDGPRAGTWNMALDFWLWKTHGPGRPPVVRFFRWCRPTVSLGHSQTPEAVVDPEACARLGVDVVRRPTGGGAVLHHHEITYSVVATPAQLGVRSPREAYDRISQALLEGLRRLGVARADVARPVGPARRVADFCFAETAHYEITVAGRKLIGSAQRWGRAAVLQHGSILLDFEARLAEVFRPGLFRPNFTTLRAVLGTVPPVPDLIRALATGWALVFGWTWQDLPETLIDEAGVRRLRDAFAVFGAHAGREPLP